MVGGGGGGGGTGVLTLMFLLQVPTPIGCVPKVMLWTNRSCDTHVTLSPDPLALIHKVSFVCSVYVYV